MSQTIKADPNNLPPKPSEEPEAKPKMRYVKVTVPEETFVRLHDMANESRMRIQPYLRRFLQEAWPYDTPSEETNATTFACGRPSRSLVNSPVLTSGNHSG